MFRMETLNCAPRYVPPSKHDVHQPSQPTVSTQLHRKHRGTSRVTRPPPRSCRNISARSLVIISPANRQQSSTSFTFSARTREKVPVHTQRGGRPANQQQISFQHLNCKFKKNLDQNQDDAPQTVHMASP